jgi:hypothetical protein
MLRKKGMSDTRRIAYDSHSYRGLGFSPRATNAPNIARIDQSIAILRGRIKHQKEAAS